jgi:hypothetical protein
MSGDRNIWTTHIAVNAVITFKYITEIGQENEKHYCSIEKLPVFNLYHTQFK